MPALKELTRRIKDHAHSLGFQKVGVAEACSLPAATDLREWLDRGYHGTMAYMERHFEKRTDPKELVEGARSVICVAMNYNTPHVHNEAPRRAKISRYAWGDDYHDVIRPKLKSLLSFIEELVPGTTGRVFVDSAPVMEKEWAVHSGIGWQGKHTNVITRDIGSWIFLGEVITNLELEYDEPIGDFCGSCNLCIEACPTGAITEPYQLDARRCISYFTIEVKPDFEILPELAQNMKNFVFGCDICQDVCPWNLKFAESTNEPSFEPRSGNLEPGFSELENLTEAQFKSRFRKSPIKRAKYRGFLRNVRAAQQQLEKPETSNPGSA